MLTRGHPLDAESEGAPPHAVWTGTASEAVAPLALDSVLPSCAECIRRRIGDPRIGIESKADGDLRAPLRVGCGPAVDALGDGEADLLRGAHHTSGEVVDLRDVPTAAALLLVDRDSPPLALGLGGDRQEIRAGVVVAIVQLPPATPAQPDPCVGALLVAPESVDEPAARDRQLRPLSTENPILSRRTPRGDRPDHLGRLPGRRVRPPTWRSLVRRRRVALRHTSPPFLPTPHVPEPPRGRRHLGPGTCERSQAAGPVPPRRRSRRSGH
jgi:hypothetical protein